MTEKPLLYLLPNVLGDGEHAEVLPSSVDRAVGQLDQLIAESEKEGRRFLKRFAYPEPKTFRDIPIHLLNEHSTPQQKQELLLQLVKAKGQRWGLISDCGMPCLADPGEELVLHAREQGVEVKALVGPSSIVLALALCGLGGQRFAFLGYLPREENRQVQEIKEIQKLSQKEGTVYLFIEAPYRNEKLLSQLLKNLEPKTWLCTATDLTLPTECVMTKRVEQWRKTPLPSIDKRPTVFVLRA